MKDEDFNLGHLVILSKGSILSFEFYLSIYGTLQEEMKAIRYEYIRLEKTKQNLEQEK